MGKFGEFFVEREEEMTPALLEELPIEGPSPTTNYYKFWMDRWQSYVSIYDAMDLVVAMVSQSVRNLDIFLSVRRY